MMNKTHSTLYIGVTSKLQERIWQHKQGKGSKFTNKYKIKKLVYYETHDSIKSAIVREKQIKAGSRRKKIHLIKNINPEFKDLSKEWYEES